MKETNEKMKRNNENKWKKWRNQRKPAQKKWQGKWQKNDRSNDRKRHKNDSTNDRKMTEKMTEQWQVEFRNDKKMTRPNDRKMTKKWQNNYFQDSQPVADQVLPKCIIIYHQLNCPSRGWEDKIQNVKQKVEPEHGGAWHLVMISTRNWKEWNYQTIIRTWYLETFFWGRVYPIPLGYMNTYPHTPIHTQYIYPLFIHPLDLFRRFGNSLALVWHWVEWVKINE